MSFKLLSIIRDLSSNLNTNDNQTICIRNDSIIKDYWQNKYETGVVGKLTIVLLGVGVLFNLIFIVASICGVRKKKLSFNLYIFLIDRSISDLITCCIIFITRILTMVDIIDTMMPQFIIIFYLLAYMMNFFTNCILSLMRLSVVKWPIWSRLNITINRSCIVIGCFWTFAIIFSVLDYVLIAPAALGKTTIICSNVNRCQQIIRFSWLSMTITTYISVIILFVITAYYVKRSNRSSVGSQRRSHSLRRLFLSVMVFVIFNSLEAPGGYLFLSLLPKLYTPTNITSSTAPSSPCDNYNQLQSYAIGQNEQIHQTFIVSIVTTMWDVLTFGRMCADPFVGIIFDEKLRKLTIEVLLTIGRLFVRRSLKVI